MKKGIFFLFPYFSFLIQSAECIFQIAFQDPVIPGLPKAPLLRGYSGQVLDLPVIITAVGKIE